MVKESYNTDSYKLLCKQSLNQECRCPLILKRTFCSLKFVRSHSFVSQYHSIILQCLVLAACILILFCCMLSVSGSLMHFHIMVWFCWPQSFSRREVPVVVSDSYCVFKNRLEQCSENVKAKNSIESHMYSTYYLIYCAGYILYAA